MEVKCQGTGRYHRLGPVMTESEEEFALARANYFLNQVVVNSSAMTMK